MENRRRVTIAIRSPVNAKGLQLAGAMDFYVSLFVPVFMYGSETMIWEEKEKSRIRMYRRTTSEVY